MKAVSAVITTVILATAALTIGLVIAFFALTTINNAVASGVYELSANVFSSLASNYDIVLDGGSYIAEFPERDVGLGYKLRNVGFKVTVTINGNSQTILDDDSVYEIYLKVAAPIEARRSVLYGKPYLIVDSLNLLPLLVERYESDLGQLIVFNTTRIYLLNTTYSYRGRNIAVIYIVYSDLEPVVRVTGTTRELIVSLANQTGLESPVLSENINTLTTVTVTAEIYDKNTGQTIKSRDWTCQVEANTTLKVYFRELKVVAVIS